jgi:hypothetical protein
MRAMLSIGKLSAGGRSERYYTQAVAHGREDYYAGAGEAPGEWTGSGWALRSTSVTSATRSYGRCCTAAIR